MADELPAWLPANRRTCRIEGHDPSSRVLSLRQVNTGSWTFGSVPNGWRICVVTSSTLTLGAESVGAGVVLKLTANRKNPQVRVNDFRKIEIRGRTGIRLTVGKPNASLVLRDGRVTLVEGDPVRLYTHKWAYVDGDGTVRSVRSEFDRRFVRPATSVPCNP